MRHHTSPPCRSGFAEKASQVHPAARSLSRITPIWLCSLLMLLLYALSASAAPISLRVMTYNTHLFGELLLFQAGGAFLPLLYRDDDRKQGLKARLSADPADIVFLQEVWSGAFADNIRDNTIATQYPNFYAANPTHGEINRFGLAIMTRKGINMKSAKKFSFSACFDLGVDLQDSVIDKGIIQVVCGITSDFDSRIPVGEEIIVGLFTTHFMTSQSSYSDAADCSYQRLTEVIQLFQEEYPGAAIILGGDFNNSPRTSKYETSFENLVLPATGLINAYDTERELDVVYYQGSGDPTPIGEWKMNEASGNLIDSTGKQAPGIPTGVRTYLAPGVPQGTYGSINVTAPSGSSIAFGPVSADGYFTVPAPAQSPVMSLKPDKCFTAMGWIHPVPSGRARIEQGNHLLFSTTGPGGSDGGWALGLSVTNRTSTKGRIRFMPYGSAALDSDDFDLSTNSFVHIAVTYLNGEINYFLNGEFIGHSDTSAPFSSPSDTARLVIGARLNGVDADQMSGRLDGLRIYDTLLTESQIRIAAQNSVSGDVATTIATTENFGQELSQFTTKSTLRDENPGFTIDKAHNELIIHFSKQVEQFFDSPDHIFFASGSETRLGVVRDRTRVISNWKLSDGLDLSDHYPLYTELQLDDPRLQPPAYKFGWTAAPDLGADTGLEADGELKLPLHYSSVLVGAGARVSGENVVTLRLRVAHIGLDGTLGRSRTLNFGSEPDGGVEVDGEVGSQEALVGIGFRASGGNITTMALYAKRLDPNTGKLVGSLKEYRFGSAPNNGLEMFVRADDDSRIATGFGLRSHNSNIEALVLHTGRLVVTPENPKRYHPWRKAVFPENQRFVDAISGPDADPDLDGAPNALEFAFGTNPLIKDSTNQWALSVTTNAADQRRVFHVKTPRNLNADAVDVVFEETSNLAAPVGSKFIWGRSSALTAGTGVESSGKLSLRNEAGSVLVGAGGRVQDNNFVTLRLHVAPILADGTLGESHIRNFGADPGGTPEVDGKVGPGEVLVGLGFAASGGNVTAMRLYAKKVDPKTGKLLSPRKEYRFGSEPNRALEQVLIIDSADDSRIAVGFGARAHDNNIEGLTLYRGILQPATVRSITDAWTPVVSGQGNAVITLGNNYDLSLKLPRVDQSSLSVHSSWPLIGQDVTGPNVFLRARAVLKAAQ